MSEIRGLYIILVSIHGLIRGEQLELGRDADTGGQTKYVVELANALAKHPQVDRVDLVTRIVMDPKVSADYAQPVEPLNAPNARIIRLPCGPRRYLRKEVLWTYLDNFADELLRHIRQVGRLPDVIHSHYADAGYVGCRVAGWLGVPLVHTGHSLGRVKHQRLLQQGTKADVIEDYFHMSTRIEAEEMTLGSAALVIASTSQEVEEQYKIYDQYQPDSMVVIPPGVALEQFYPPRADWQSPPIRQELVRFLQDPDKPFIFALSRPELRKNVSRLLRAYGEDPKLQALANLVIVLGNRQDISNMEPGPKRVMTEVLMLIDRYDLYGRVAYPKHHKSDDVPDLYRLAYQQRGVFINPALTEPFGLTLIEATACGVPIIATADGGPRDILAACQNGQLIDPFSVKDIQQALCNALTDPDQWLQWSKNGLDRVCAHFSWESHVEQYLKQLHQKFHRQVHPKLSPLLQKPMINPPGWEILSKNRLPTAQRFLICEIDNTLLGDREALQELLLRLKISGQNIGLGIATGRPLQSALSVMEEWKIPVPDMLITSAGSEIYYGPQIVPDTYWKRHIDYRWDPNAVRLILREIEGLQLQPDEFQSYFKISYFIDPAKAPSVSHLLQLIRRQQIHVNCIYSHQMYLDFLPIRASKGDALRYCALKWGIPVRQFLVAGASGNDETILTGNTLAVVVGNHRPELEKLRDNPLIYFAEGHNAWGILEALDHYQFFEPLPPLNLPISSISIGS